MMKEASQSIYRRFWTILYLLIVISQDQIPKDSYSMYICYVKTEETYR